MAEEDGRRPSFVFFNNMVTPYSDAVYRALAERDIELTVLSCTQKEANRNWGQVETGAYRHRVLPGFNVRLGSGRFAHVNRGIWKALDAASPDALVINGFYPSMVVAAHWARARRRPLALTIDGWARTMPGSPYHRLVRPHVLSLCSAVFVCGDKGRDYFLGQGMAPDAVHMTPLAPAWNPPDRTPGLEERPYHLLWVSQFNNDAKNADFLADLAVTLSGSVAGFRLRLVGQGPALQPVLRKLDQARVAYRHDAAIAWRDMAEVYQSARMLALPSLWEPWGLVCNEAMSCGAPCIVSPLVGAADDLVIDGVNGFVAELDITSWAAAIRRCLDDPALWSRLSGAARQAVSTRTPSRSAAVLHETLTGLTDGAGRRR